MDLNDLKETIKIKKVKNNVNFWFVRTKKGTFYTEFIEENYIALGWNRISQDTIKNLKTNNEESKLLDELKNIYKNKKRPRYMLNQSDCFVNKMNTGDIVIIPDRNKKNISFGKLINYFENPDSDVDTELRTVKLVESEWKEHLNVKCPYKKRWRVKWMKTLPIENVHPKLMLALSSRHGVSNMCEYAQFILSPLYGTYYWNNAVHVSFHVNKTDNISAVDMSKFIYANAKIINDISHITDISLKSNINSSGDIILSIKCALENIPQLSICLAVVWIMIFGGEIKGYKIGSILSYFYDFREQNNKFENDKLDREKKKLENKKLQLDINYEEMQRNLKILENSSNSLEIDKTGINNIIKKK